MIRVSALVVCLLSLPPVRPQPRTTTTTRRFKPLIQVTEEIDINDITFTTSAPDFHHHTKATYNDGYGVPPQKPYHPPLKYKPYKVVKVHEGFRRPLLPYKSGPLDKTKLSFEPPTTHGSPDQSKLSPKLASKLVPFSSQSSSPSKPPVKASAFPAPDNRDFIPSPTSSPTLLPHINTQNTHRYTEPYDTKPLTTQTLLHFPNPTKNPHRIRHPSPPSDNHRFRTLSDDFPTTPTSHPNPPNPLNPPSDSPQQSESFLSEVSTLHKGQDNLDDVADSLDFKTGERVEFQMYGMDGPKSYKFGFDTGKGHNRHFRFEERDNEGKVKGHYGYVDEDGKMRIMKYEADPITGFHAGPVEISPEDN